MKFGPVPVAAAQGAILAHSLWAGDRRFAKGKRLSAADLRDLAHAGVQEVVVARLEDGDLCENDAAKAVADAMVKGGMHLQVDAPCAGRVNIRAGRAGLFHFEASAIHALNGVDPAVTAATLADMAKVAPRALVATIKIMPFAVGEKTIAAACGCAELAGMRLLPFRLPPSTLIQTVSAGVTPRMLEKGARAVARRIEALGGRFSQAEPVAHEEAGLARALAKAPGDLLLILTACATSDVQDVAPSALCAAGGRLIRFGMPVDPGNLLFLGKLGDKTVIGLPGCARSPALNGVDLVLERIAAGQEPGMQEIAAMGVGGLLKEIPTRPQPRVVRPGAGGPPKVELLLLAAGASRRMGGKDKLLRLAQDEPLLRRVAGQLVQSRCERLLVALPPQHDARRAALDGIAAQIVETPDWQEGMAASIRALMQAVSPDTDAVVLALADMPDVTAEHVDALIEAFAPHRGHEICRACDAAGNAGHPVLFGRRFFEPLAALAGDAGARSLLIQWRDFVMPVPTPGHGATTDLDTPDDWESWLGSDTKS